jgi:tripartite-type tricarboxylate transporter receptor subunit TctC
VAKLNAQIDRILRSDDLHRVFGKDGLTVKAGSPEAFRAFLDAQAQQWSDVIRQGKISLD